MSKTLFYKLLSFYLAGFFVFVPFVYAQQDETTSSSGQRGSNRDKVRKERLIRSFGTETKGSDEGQIYIPTTPQSSATGSLSITYTVHVLGEVEFPGTYRMAPSDRVVDALNNAGGILSSGSERRLELRRRGVETDILDLFSYKYHGNLNENPYLMENDVIFVPLKKGEIQIEGPVSRPGNYEISKNISMKNVIKLAGGVTSGLSTTSPIRVIRYNDREEKEVLEVTMEPDILKNFMVKKGDVVVLPHILIADKEFDYNLRRIPGDNIFYPTIDDNVYVVGAVSLPGVYEFKPHYSYKEYVNLAGPVQSAKMRQIKVLRPNGKKISAKSNTNINPGDTIIVPRRYWKPEVAASWLSTVTSLVLSTFLIYDRVKE